MENKEKTNKDKCKYGKLKMKYELIWRMKEMKNDLMKNERYEEWKKIRMN